MLSLQATIFSNTFLKHKSNAIRRYDRGRCLERLHSLGKAHKIAVLKTGGSILRLNKAETGVLSRLPGLVKLF